MMVPNQNFSKVSKTQMEALMQMTQNVRDHDVSTSQTALLEYHWASVNIPMFWESHETADLTWRYDLNG